MRVPIRKLGLHGLAYPSDTPPEDPPLNAFTDGDGGAFRDRAARKTYGYRNEVIDFPEDVFWFQSWEDGDVITVAFAAEDQIYTTVDGQYVNQATLEDQAGAVMANMATPSQRWQSDVFGRFCIMNNTQDIPVYSEAYTAGPPAVWNFKEIPGWGTGVGPTGSVRSIRAAYNHLIALGVVNYPYTVFCSTRGTPEAMPTSWDTSDTTQTARSFPLQSKDGPIVDGGMLNGRFMIYQRYATTALDYVGGSYVFNARRVIDVGLCNPDAFVAFENFHLVVGEKEIVIHDGSSIVARPDDNRIRRRFYGEVSDLTKVKCSKCYMNHEVLIHYNDDRLLIYNFRENTWSFESLGRDIARIDRAISPAVPTSWAEMVMSWSSASMSWAALAGVDRVTRLYHLQPRSLDIRNTGYTRQGDDNSFLSIDGTDRVLESGSAGSGDRILLESSEMEEYDAWLMREFVDLDELTGDDTRVKRVDEIWLQIKGSGPIDFQVGTSFSTTDAIAWQEKVTFNMSDSPEQFKVDVRAAGRYLHYRLGSWDGTKNTGWWALSGMSLEVNLEGPR